jgi:hypothetical protein
LSETGHRSARSPGPSTCIPRRSTASSRDRVFCSFSVPLGRTGHSLSSGTGDADRIPFIGTRQCATVLNAPPHPRRRRRASERTCRRWRSRVRCRS